MRLFCCFNTLGFKLGGVESYYMRMYEWAKSNQFVLLFFMPEGCVIQEEWMEDFYRLNIEIALYTKMGKKIKIKSSIIDSFNSMSKDSLCITNSLDTFMIANEIFRVQAEKIRILFYVLHPYAVQLCRRKMVNCLLAGHVLNKIKQDYLVFMDEETKDFAKKCYDKMDFSKSRIIRLGMDIPPYSSKQRKTIFYKNDFSILTIARLDFPFKGYISGLIDTYVNLRKRFNNITLTIVGDGAGKTELEQKINHISDASIISDIHMLGYLPYNEIQKYIEQANLFIGMGTTILDSAKYGVPGIVATAYQMEDYAAGFFHMDYTCIGRLIDEEGAKKYRFEELVEQIYAMSEEEYLKTCGDAYSLVHKHYGIENCMEQIMAMDAKRKIAPSFGITLFYNYMLPLWEKLKGAGDD